MSNTNVRMNPRNHDKMTEQPCDINVILSWQILQNHIFYYFIIGCS